MEVEKPPVIKDNRNANRKRVLGSGRVVHGDGAYNVGCTIRDISKGGAKIRLSGASPIPKSVFFIDVPGKTAYQAEVAWRNGPCDLGLKFVAEHPLNLKLPHELRYLNRIWIDACAR